MFCLLFLGEFKTLLYEFGEGVLAFAVHWGFGATGYFGVIFGSNSKLDDEVYILVIRFTDNRVEVVMAC